MRSEAFQKLCSDSRTIAETNDCAVKAVAIVCDLEDDYAGVREIFRIKGRRPRRGTPPWMTKSVLDWLGFETEDVTRRFQAKTVRTLGREVRYRGGTYLVHVRGHILAVKGGKVHDWTDGRCHRITKIERVYPKEGVEQKIECS